jgi:menaquinone-9 beta-reductase
LLNASYSTGRPFNLIQQLLFSAGTKDARTAQLLGEFAAGLIGVSRLLSPAALGRALWVNLATVVGRACRKDNLSSASV